MELVCQVRKRPKSDRTTALSPKARAEQELVLEVPQSATVENIGGDTFKPYSCIEDNVVAKDPNEPQLPSVEVFTPEGKHVAQRRSLGAWALWSSKKKSNSGQH